MARVVFETTTEKHELLGFDVIRPQRNSAGKSHCWIWPDRGEGNDTILAALGEAFTKIRPYLPNCPIVGSVTRDCGDLRYAIVHIEIDPFLIGEQRSEFLDLVRGKFPSPPDHQLDIGYSDHKRMMYSYMRRYSPALVTPAPQAVGVEPAPMIDLGIPDAAFG
jgi:hypothetical protein